MESTKLTVKRVPIDALRADPANARLHGTLNLDAIAGSLARFGQAEPLVVQQGSNRVIAGNGRLAAMQKLGWSECDVVEVAVDDLTATALGIALNRRAELAEWDDGMLARLLDGLRSEDALVGVGFSDNEIERGGPVALACYRPRGREHPSLGCADAARNAPARRRCTRMVSRRDPDGQLFGSGDSVAFPDWPSHPGVPRPMGAATREGG